MGTSVKGHVVHLGKGGKIKNFIMARAKDALGRLKRKYRKREDPLKVFRKTEFEARYRLSKRLVVQLSNKFKPYNSTKGRKNGGGLTHAQRFCLALRYFSTGGIYSLCGDVQHVSKALVSRAVRDVSNYFYRHQQKYIKWPGNFEEKNEKAMKFFKHKNQHTPNIIGMVDGTHVPILTPRVNEACYVNRRHYHSINATVYADFDKRIINVDARWPGSVNDAYAFHASPIGDLCNSGGMGKFILLADSGYALKKNVFTPYKKPSTPKQEKYNTWHRRNRARVEQAIGLLKQRFRCIDSSSGYLYHTPQRAAKIFITCCCLHNVAMDYGIRIISHRNDPWVPKRKALKQPRQRTLRQVADDIKRVRDAYVRKHF